MIVTDDVFPDRSMSEHDKISWMLETDGWALVPVRATSSASGPVPGYSFTIGLGAWSFPDVVVYGLAPVAARGIVGELVDILKGGGDVPIGAPFVGLFDGGLRSALLSIDDLAGRFPIADAWYGSATWHMVQLTYPDPDGWLPWEPGFDRRMVLAQPLIGRVPT